MAEIDSKGVWPLFQSFKVLRTLNRYAPMLVLTAAIGLGACALIEPQRPAASNAPFDLSGRVAVNFEGRSFSSGVRWQHAAGREEVWLMTPLGQTIAHIISDDGGAILTSTDQKQYRAASVESLTRQALGWELPLTRLTWWVRGEPVPGKPPGGAERDERGRLTFLEQDGWRIAFVNYPPGEQGGQPRRLDLKSAAHEIRFVIDAWRLADAAQ
jgi:outer membrane lipoprotein LolB